MTSTIQQRGLFITFEGGDGVGKSTQQAMLGEWLGGRGFEVVLTREPGGTELGLVLRQALLHGGHVDPHTEALLYATDRAHHVHSLVRPALERGAMVVSDRYLDSSVAYQGAARQLGTREMRELSLWATGGLLPDLTVLLDLDESKAQHRRGDAAPDRLERESAAFHRRVREIFLELADNEPERFRVLDAGAGPEEVHRAVVQRVEELLARRAAEAPA